MIKSIHMKNVATYDPTSESLIGGLKKVNFIFGYNGSGKSTIARFLEDTDNIKFKDCSIDCDENEQILVFNENFVKNNFTNDLNGVFSLDATNAQIDSQIKEKENLINKYSGIVSFYARRTDHFSTKLEEKKEDAVRACWNKRVLFKTFPKIAFEYTRNKNASFDYINSILTPSLCRSLSETDLISVYKSLYEDEINKVDETIENSIISEIEEIERTLQGLMQEIFVGNEDIDIAGLIKSLNSSSWVQAGIEFISKSDDKCPFCQQEINSNELKGKFDKFFDEKYKNGIAKICDNQKMYDDKVSALIDILKRVVSAFNPNGSVSNLITELNSLKNTNLNLVRDKLEIPNEKKIIQIIDKSKLYDLGKKIEENNNNVLNLDDQKDNLKNNIWKEVAIQCALILEKYKCKSEKLNRIIEFVTDQKKVFQDKIKAENVQIDTLRKQTVDTGKAVDSMNQILKRADFIGFSIKEKKRENNISKYSLVRPNSFKTSFEVFDSLSEGEKHFVSFLYFYQLCIGTDDQNNTKKKIIVIDDPVSSLDSQILFVISTLILSLIEYQDKKNKKELRNKNISQVIVLTHNIYFYKEVTLPMRPACTDHVFIKLFKVNDITQIEIQINNTITDDYSMLWDSLKDFKRNISSATLSSSNIMISNTMRRIIDSYVNFMGCGKDCWSSLYNTEKETIPYFIKSAFLSSINDDSHKVMGFSDFYFQRINEINPMVLFNSFESIFNQIGKEHYTLMMKEHEA
jgi:wobble nucleotide-excising tRNase